MGTKVTGIRYNKCTGTYYVYRECKPVLLTKSLTQKEKHYMQSAQRVDEDGIFVIYRYGENK